MSAFDTARDVRLPGIVIDRVYIDPKQLTTRMKNAVKKMLREGKAHGGWGSKSKALAMKLSKCHDLSLVHSTGWGFYAPQRQTYDDEQVKQILHLIDADEAIELMQDARDYGGNDQRTQYVQARTRERHARNRDIIQGNTSFRWMAPSGNKEFMYQIIDIFANGRSAALREKAEKMCGMIDNNEPIPITLSN